MPIKLVKKLAFWMAIPYLAVVLLKVIMWWYTSTWFVAALFLGWALTWMGIVTVGDLIADIKARRFALVYFVTKSPILLLPVGLLVTLAGIFI